MRNAGRRKGPTSTEIDIAALDSAQCLSTHMAESMRRDMTWILCRLATEEEIETAFGISQESQLVPSWTDFNIAVSRDVPCRSVVGYCPVVNEATTKLDTVYTVIRKSLAMADEFDQNDVIMMLKRPVPGHYDD